MYTKSIFASRMALRLRMPCARGISGANTPYNPFVDPRVIMDIYKEIHECGITHLKASYENEISRLRQEITTMRDEASKQEQKQDMQRLELREVEADKISLLHEVARLRETVTAKRSLGAYRFSIDSPDVTPDLRYHRRHLPTSCQKHPKTTLLRSPVYPLSAHQRCP